MIAFCGGGLGLEAESPLLVASDLTDLTLLESDPPASESLSELSRDPCSVGTGA